ncbi:MAG: ribosome biogenesis GTPase Der [Candidatus Hydrogenedentales bacterium]|jgi:GTP-binding protein
MTRRAKLPLVAICGRPNVGKSTLFNRLVGRQRAIVHLEEGITRDRTYAAAEWEGRQLRMVDTGGIVEHPTDPITHKIQEQVRVALKEARAVIFVVDGQQELTRVDFEVRDELRRLGKPVVLAVNKLDNHNMQPKHTEFYELGLGEPIAISSTHNLGIEALMDAVVAHLPEAPAAEPEAEDGEAAPPERAVTRVAIVGKPNVGKSSFVNALLNEERSIVDSTPGTTRDAIDIDFHWKDKDYLLIDTAGMRRRSGIKKEVELFSVARALRAVRRADVCLVMMDATDVISEQDKRIVNYVKEQGRGMILVWTKWDLVENKEQRFKALAEEIDLKAPFLRHVPYVTVSNLSRQRLFTTFEFIDRVMAETEKRVTTGALNAFLDELKTAQPPSSHKGGTPKIKYATQASVKPTTFVLFVNKKSLFHFSYLRYVENRIREKFGFEGVPITVELRQSNPKE